MAHTATKLSPVFRDSSRSTQQRQIHTTSTADSKEAPTPSTTPPRACGILVHLKFEKPSHTHTNPCLLSLQNARGPGEQQAQEGRTVAFCEAFERYPSITSPARELTIKTYLLRVAVRASVPQSVKDRSPSAGTAAQRRPLLFCIFFVG